MCVDAMTRQSYTDDTARGAARSADVITSRRHPVAALQACNGIVLISVHRSRSGLPPAHIAALSEYQRSRCSSACPLPMRSGESPAEDQLRAVCRLECICQYTVVVLASDAAAAEQSGWSRGWHGSTSVMHEGS